MKSGNNIRLVLKATIFSLLLTNNYGCVKQQQVDLKTYQKKMAPRYSEWVMVWRGVYPTSEVFLHYES